ncbi:NACHT and Ankyrin domain protein [Colletotrichum scovillei]|uniref:NACHT and Ankyrin domain protein n=2 Tax=Colletotrichum scovillei TaxID=1209932 RepID=A0A9P7RKH6_9PEZI|nr:NACHT and Ankyrin domain protein [Colletotrichum scovillei]KAG7076913.1 NACHT and Ankyrin domain protein [Colletotrichum scovillei]KAG7084005.1 NACHT and Ankyrin domain protein [Colletotrichum scovillei]
MTPRRIENTLKSRSTLWAIFTATIKDPELGPVYCVLDGLNDFPPDERRWLVSSFQAQFGRSSGAQVQPETLNTFKLIISSAANEGFHECLHLTPTLDGKDPENDLECVIKARLARHRHWGILDKESQDALAGELSLRSEGLFSWVDFMLEDLYPEKTLSAMMKKMDQIPCGLRHVFLRLLVQIDDKSRRETAKILQWVALLRRPVTVAELTDLIHPDAEEPEEERQRIQDLVSESYPLMRITKAGRDYTEREAEEDIILPLHRSIADYMSNIDMDSAIKDFYLKPEKTHYEIAKKCLDELQIWFKRAEETESIIEVGYHSIFRHTRWLRYARDYWPWHARRSGEQSLQFLAADSIYFHEESLFRTVWWYEYKNNARHHRGEYDRMKEVLPSTNILHICSGLGFLQIVRTLLEKHPDAASYVNEEEEDGDTPLSYATRYNHSDVAELLVRYGAHVMRQINEIYWNNLEYAFHIPIINAFANANVRLARFLIKPTCAQIDDPYRKVMLGIYLICKAACVSKGTKSRQLAELVLDNIEINITETKKMFSLAPWRRSVYGHPSKRNLDVPDLIIYRLLRSDRKVLRDVDIFPSAVGYAARHPSIGAELLRACLIHDVEDLLSSEYEAKTTLHPIV